MAIRGVINRLRHSHDAMLLAIVAVNIAVFLLLRIVAIAGMFAGADDAARSVMLWLELPSSLSSLARRPWTLLTYMFTHYDVLHILFNMLWLYWFATLFCLRASSRQLLTLYIAGGLGGAVAFMAFYAFSSAGGALLLGASASVMAIVTATAIIMPDFEMRLLFFGAVKLKWIAIATIALVVIGVTGINVGGEMAHLGGIAVGVGWGLAMRRGHDPSRPLWLLARKLRRRKADAPTPLTLDATDRQTLDLILEKVKKSGYASLGEEERRLLFEISRNIK